MAKKIEEPVVAPVEPVVEKPVVKPVEAPVVPVAFSTEQKLDALCKFLGLRFKVDAGKLIVVK